MSQAVTRLLALTVLALLAALGWQWVDERGQRRPIVWNAPEPLLPSLESGLPDRVGPLHPTAEQLAELELRPLFSPSRRPPPPKLPPPPPPPPDPLDFTSISGLLTGDAGMVLATVQGQFRRLKVGGKVGEWELKSVTTQGAQFAKGDQTRDLAITRVSLGAAAPKAPPSSAPSVAAGAPARASSSASNSVDARREAQRETLRRRNELRAQRGLPPVPE
ncbi:MAG: hypothetical protein Q8S02_08040 [Hydrogenophaga sp.]|nr:hypothetical protein [Hydrogenophaga sp.]